MSKKSFEFPVSATVKFKVIYSGIVSIKYLKQETYRIFKWNVNEYNWEEVGTEYFSLKIDRKEIIKTVIIHYYS